MIQLKINGEIRDLDVPPEMPLLWALRDRLTLTGTKYGCGRALCGACTVHLDGQAARSCSIMVGEVGDREVTTIEAVNGEVAEAVQTAWRDLDVVQCGYCQSGQIMSAITILSHNKNPTNQEIDLGMEGNICRCGTYVRIREAIHNAAARLRTST
jgi:isoquinoline 1-oxidoreductase subunit alpha